MGGTLSRSAWLVLVAIGAVNLALPSRGAEATIVFASNRSGSMDVYVMDPDGENARNVSRNVAWDWYPTWSPGGEEIAFSSQRGGDGEIYAMGLIDGRARRLTRRAGLDIAPSWSPDGRRIAYEHWDGTSKDVSTMDTDGANPRQLADGAWAASPAWSMAGSRIAYSARDAIYAVGPREGDPVRIIGERGFDLAWSPDDRRIAYSLFDNGNWDICVMDVDGGAERRLTRHGGLDYDPAWSPDGAAIAFTSERDGGSDIFIVDVDGRDNPRNITRSGTLDGQPAWARPGASLWAAAAGVVPTTWGWLRRVGVH